MRSRLTSRIAALLIRISLIIACFYAFAVFQPSAAQNTGATPSMVLTGARLIDGTGRAPIERGDVLIRNGRIEAVGVVSAPPDVVKIDMTGKTIIPGLINAHAHVDVNQNSTQSLREQLDAQLKLYADYGVTTVYSLGDDGVESIRLRDEQRRGMPNRARLYAAGENVVAPTAEQVRKDIEAAAARKVDIIKTRVDGPDNAPQRMAPSVYAALIDHAHKNGLRVAAHMFFLKDAKGLVDAGVDILAHSVRDMDMDAALISEMKRRNVGYVPTLTRDLSVFAYESTPAFFSDPFFTREPSYRPVVARLADPAAQARVRSNANSQAIKQALVQANRNLKMAQDAGIMIAMGTDTGAGLGRWQGYFEHLELEMMVAAGLTPMQALVAATGNAAKVTKVESDLGTLESGKWADFVVLNASPLTDIRNTKQIDSVWIAGRKLER